MQRFLKSLANPGTPWNQTHRPHLRRRFIDSGAVGTVALAAAGVRGCSAKKTMKAQCACLSPAHGSRVTAQGVFGSCSGVDAPCDLAATGAPLLIAYAAKRLFQRIIRAWKASDRVALKQMFPIAARHAQYFAADIGMLAIDGQDDASLCCQPIRALRQCFQCQTRQKIVTGRQVLGRAQRQQHAFRSSCAWISVQERCTR